MATDHQYHNLRSKHLKADPIVSCSYNGICQLSSMVLLGEYFFATFCVP